MPVVMKSVMGSVAGRLILAVLALAACKGSSSSDGLMPDGPTPDGSIPSDACTAGQSTPCAMLGGSWAGGSATCRDGGAWDISACTLASPGMFEEVKPAEREPDRFADARCNDGTAFDFRVRLAPHPSPIWVVYLEGGFYCDDYSSPCSTRPDNLKSTNPGTDASLANGDNQGLFNPSATVNPDFDDKNEVYAHYCSSDFWAGATTSRLPSTGDPTNGWYFSGHINVDAMIAILIERYGLDDSSPALRVLLTGSSAGAFGAHFNEARTGAAIPNAAAAGRLMLLVDAGWMTDWDDPMHRMGTATTPDADVWHRARAFWGATFDPDCEAAASDPSTCFMAPSWYPFVSARVPTLIQQCRFDQSFTSAHHLASTDASAASWQSEVTTSLATVPWLFSGSTPSYHTLLGSDAGFATGPTGSTLEEVLDRFWNGGAPERVLF